MADYLNYAAKILKQVQQVVVGKDTLTKKVLMAVLARGHVLIEDIPGVGKTTLALSFSRAMALEANRMQFTPDVLPSDVTGFYMYEEETKEFRYRQGPVMCHLFLADEINRTSPKTQSALLEVMEERKVTVDGNTFSLPDPFIVIATQNPAGSAGTQLLPESQLDRFMITLSLGYPDISSEIAMVKNRQLVNPLDSVTPVIHADMLVEMQKETERTYIHNTIYQYIAALITKTRSHEMVELGVSPRGTLALAKMSQSCAYLQGRDYVIPDDVSSVFPEVVTHRLGLNAKARLSHTTKADIINEILKTVPQPKP